MDLHVTQQSEGALFRRCVVNNAAYDYYSRCTEDDLDVAPPPDDLRIWIFPDLTCSSANMLHHGAFMNQSLITAYLKEYLPLVKLFLPDVTIDGQCRSGLLSLPGCGSHPIPRRPGTLHLDHPGR